MNLSSGLTAVDLFAGFGGMSLGASLAGVRVRWAGNHDPDSVAVHSLNHPDTEHVCQDLRQADWTQLPRHDLLLAGPACQGHSYGGQPGRKKSNKVQVRHDALRGTAWSVIDCAMVTLPRAIIVENVVPFLKWSAPDAKVKDGAMFQVWCNALRALDYHVQWFTLWASHFNVPQRRHRAFVVATRRRPVKLDLVQHRRHTDAPEATFRPCIDWGAPGWRPITESTPDAQERMRNAQRRLGPVCLSQHVTDHPGVSLDEPIRTITTANGHWVLVNGEECRPLTGRELARGQGFPDDFRWHGTLRDGRRLSLTEERVTEGIGNAVPPPLARNVVRALVEAL